MARAQDTFASFDRLVDVRSSEWIDDLRERCRIPSEAAQAAPLADAADWVVQRLRSAGCDVHVIEREGVPPVVVGEIGSGERTLICVQHYDVQPAAPLGLWESPPFEPTVRDGRLFARGVVDNKGHLVMRIGVLEAYRAAFGELPCRVRFIVEGEEEAGSRHLAALLAERDGVLRAHGALNEGGQSDADGLPVLSCGVRGMFEVELTARVLSQDAHSMYASLLPNAAWRLIEALATFRSSGGDVTIDGFMDDARPPTEQQLAQLRAAAFDAAAFRRQFGISSFVGGVDGAEAYVAQLFRPTCNIAGITAGWTGVDMKTVTPAVASAKVDMRLIPDQDPDRLGHALRAHLDRRGFSDITFEIRSAERAYWTPVTDPLVEAAARAVEQAYGRVPQRLVSGPGTAPMHQICAPHGLPFVALGMTHQDARLHAPNENLRLDLIAPVARATGRFLKEFAACES